MIDRAVPRNMGKKNKRYKIELATKKGINDFDQ